MRVYVLYTNIVILMFHIIHIELLPNTVSN